MKRQENFGPGLNKEMDLDDFRSFISDSGLDVWTWIDMAISVASVDHEIELRNRRDGIVQKLYAPAFSRSQNCDYQFVNGNQENVNYRKKQDVGCDYNPEKLQLGKIVSEHEEEGEDTDTDDEERKILEIKILRNDPYQSESCLIELLQRLVDMNITFKVLKETDIGRHVAGLRKHSCNEVRRLVKILVRKWKDTVDEWVITNTSMEDQGAQFNGNKEPSDEAQLKNSFQNGMKNEMVPNGLRDVVNDHSPSYLILQKGKVKGIKMQSNNSSSSPKRFNWNCQEPQNAKQQKTAQAMDFHHIPETKKAIFTSKEGNVPVKYS